MSQLLQSPEIQTGYSPKPVRQFATLDTTSPSDSNDPDTQSPNGKMEGPDLSRGKPSIPDTSDFTSTEDGIVVFAK